MHPDGRQNPMALFEALTGHAPMRWQRRLLQCMREGHIPDAVDLPTGLGKTSVMALWLIARACPAGAPVLPRRLIYIVDRRAVVDQATNAASELAQQLRPETCDPCLQQLRHALGLAPGGILAVSTLRGALADHGAWLRDPAAPAIIVGTIDMIGSRLLFEGYGVSRKMRPLHAGLLGVDTLFVLDEAHLVPPFEALLRQIAAGHQCYGPVDRTAPLSHPRLLTLSATPTSGGNRFALEDEDQADEVAQRRIHASKRLHARASPVARKALAKTLAELAWTHASSAARTIVFCDRREDAAAVVDELRKRPETPPCALLVGERRGLERQAIEAWITQHGFDPKTPATVPGPAFLVATSAGEVGIDLDADHMVGDVVEWERMVQRLGRVNRRGNGDARIDLVAVAPENPAKLDDRQKRQAATARLLPHLPEAADGGRDASPGALMTLKSRADLAELRGKASTPSPLRPALSRALVDAWSLTALRDHPGRPEIAPWLRGWVDDDPQTTVIWRRFLPWRRGEAPAAQEVEAYFEQAPPQREERLQAPTWRALETLRERAKTLLKAAPERAGDPAMLVLDPALELQAHLTLEQLADRKQEPSRIVDRILVVAAELGGLSQDGLLDKAAAGAPVGGTLDGEDGMAWSRLRILQRTPDTRPAAVPEGWALAHAWPARRDEDGETLEEIGIWTDKARRAEPARSRAPQTLADHTAAVVACAEALAGRIGLDAQHSATLSVAARLHDAGKAEPRWQDAFRAPLSERPYAKTAAAWVNQALLDGYRHEFGSLAIAADDRGLRALPAELRDLALHLIAAHHGFARPLIRHGGDDARAAEVALRFGRLQRRWGPWGLAWWEALLRAADAQASRQHDEGLG